jgi:predicted dehydrogenase
MSTRSLGSVALRAKKSRREFLKTTLATGAATVAAPYFIPSSVLGGQGRGVAPSDRIVFGAIGTGSRSYSNTGALKNLPGCEFAAVCDVDLARARTDAGPDRLGVDGKFVYQDYRRLLENKDIDAVVISSPDHWHALQAIHAAQAGKDVYVEKAMTLTVHEGRVMVDATRNNKRVLQVGSQQRSNANFHRACMLVRNGYIGKVTKVVGVNFAGAWESRLPAEPVPTTLDWDLWMDRSTRNPSTNIHQRSRGLALHQEFCGGGSADGARNVDQVQWALGMDERPHAGLGRGSAVRRIAEGRQGRPFFGPKETVVHMMYPGDITSSSPKTPTEWRALTRREGPDSIDRDRFEVINPDGRRSAVVPIQHTAADHYANFVEAIRERKKPVADVEIGHRSATVCHLGNIARWVSQRTQTVGEKLNWDPVKEQFTNSALANSMLDRPRRKGYELPRV